MIDVVISEIAIYNTSPQKRMRAFHASVVWAVVLTALSALSTQRTYAFSPSVPLSTSQVIPVSQRMRTSSFSRRGGPLRAVVDGKGAGNVDKTPSSTPWLTRASALRRPAAVIVGSTFAFCMQHGFSLPSPLVAPVTLGIISAALINIVGLPLTPYQAPFYVGAFAGTTSTALMSSLPAISLLSLVVVSLFEVFERKGLFPGKGGRLGACATMSSAVFALLISKLSLLSELRALLSPPFSVPSLLAPFAFASAGAVACTALRRKGWTPVSASATLGSLGTLGIRGSLGGFFYAGTFIGESARGAK